ncbi:hypothetical protein QMT40_002799 [Parvibaculaceae bacterium PLY_AMNH_Bact1]|nr:hypothetical protein QMT40_002799 [Parvibaculaceae bacterium PLY_AMNH_Bact1]
MVSREEYLLTCLSEEAAEVIQRASKAIRFGLDSTEPAQTHTNRERLCGELTDLLAIVAMLNDECALAHAHNSELIKAKIDKVDKYFQA